MTTGTRYYVGSTRQEGTVTKQQRYRKRHRARVLFARRGVRLVVLGTTDRPTGWLIESYHRKEV